MHAHKARTPTLNICGALDRCTPPEEAVQFHNALLENGTKSVLLIYPEEGHGLRKFPAVMDYADSGAGYPLLSRLRITKRRHSPGSNAL